MLQHWPDSGEGKLSEDVKERAFRENLHGKSLRNPPLFGFGNMRYSVNHEMAYEGNSFSRATLCCSKQLPSL